MAYPITSLFAALFTLMFVALSINVVRLRRHHKVALLDGRHDPLVRAARAQGNFAEYVPLFLMVLFLLESADNAPWMLYALGLLMLAGRISHFYGVVVAEPHRNQFQFRIGGMVSTFSALGIGALLLLVQTLL